MGVVFSIFLIAVGAILRYATNFDVRSVDVDEVGLILMIVGAVGFVLSLLYEVLWARERSRWFATGAVAATSRRVPTSLVTSRLFLSSRTAKEKNEMTAVSLALPAGASVAIPGIVILVLIVIVILWLVF